MTGRQDRSLYAPEIAPEDAPDALARALPWSAGKTRASRVARVSARFAAGLAVTALLSACSQPDNSAPSAGATTDAPAVAADSSPAVVADAPANDYASAWGPSTGSQIPMLAATDHTGTPQTLGSLSGDRGLLLVFSRSADW